jgi:hypothetical protein
VSLLQRRLDTMKDFFDDISQRVDRRRNIFAMLRLYWQVGTIGFYLLVIGAKYLEKRLTESFLRDKKAI